MEKSCSRKIAVAAAGVALLTLIPVALYQTHVIETLPDPPGPWFDSPGITRSKAARPLGIPDGLLGLGSYGVTLALLLAARRSGLAAKLLQAKLVADGGAAGFNVVRQAVSFRKFCSWCTATALATAVLVPAGLRYARARRTEG